MAEEKKIIIDEDWKSQVEAEKEELQRGPKSETTAGPDADAQAESGPLPPLPPASLETLLSMLATEAAISMGQLPHPETGKPDKNLDQAQYLIDTIAMLEEKTRGNLSAEEATGISGLLHQLRMLFVSVQAQS